MAEGEHDDVADALSRLAGGDVAPSEHEPSAAPPPPPIAPARPPAASPFRPASPTVRAPRPDSPAPAATPPAPSGPARPQRPAAPTIRPSFPSVPNLAAPVPVDEADDAVVDDDDTLNIPAPDASAFTPRPKASSTAEAKARVARQRQLDFRQTLIPILLTTGVVMLAFGSARFLAGPDSILAAIPGWVPASLLLSGAVLLGLAVVNMVSVTQLLANARK